MCLLRCTTRHAKLGHAKKDPSNQCSPNTGLSRAKTLGQPQTSEYKKTQLGKKAANRCWQEADGSFGRWRNQGPRGNHRALAFAAKLL